MVNYNQRDWKWGKISSWVMAIIRTLILYLLQQVLYSKSEYLFNFFNWCYLTFPGKEQRSSSIAEVERNPSEGARRPEERPSWTVELVKWKTSVDVLSIIVDKVKYKRQRCNMSWKPKMSCPTEPYIPPFPFFAKNNTWQDWRNRLQTTDAEYLQHLISLFA